MPTTLVIETHDGRKIEIVPTLEDTLAFESTLRKNKRWGEFKENVLKIIPFKAWNAARRAGLIEQTWDEFSSGPTAVLDVTVKRDDDDTDEAGDDAPREVEGVGKAGRKARSTTSS